MKSVAISFDQAESAQAYRCLTPRINVRFAFGLILSGLCLPAFGQISHNPNKFLGNILRHGAPVDPNFSTYWNQVTPEDSGKWMSVEYSRDVMDWTNLDYMYGVGTAPGMSFKEHALVWGQQYPAHITSLSAAEQKVEVSQWISAFGARYPNTQYVDVVNEPLHATPPFKDALGGNGSTGWDWVIWSFQQARNAMPHAKLILNDYGILSSNDNTTKYLTIINLLKERGLIDGIGEQGHGWESTTTSTIQSNLSRLTATGLPVYITELDLKFSSDSSQLSRYKALFPVLWENPSVRGVTLWGYKQNQLWQTSAYLLRANGTERPALTWMKNYVAATEASFTYDTTAGDQTYGSVLANSTGNMKALSKYGPGMLTLTAKNTYTGDTNVHGGVLRLQGNAFSTKPRYYHIDTGAVLNLFGNTGIATGTTPIAGSGTLRISGGGFSNGTGSGRAVTFWLSPDGVIDIQPGASMMNGGWKSFIWNENSGRLNVDGVFDMGDNNNPVFVGGLSGSGLFTKSAGTDTVELTVGVDNGSATFSGTISNMTGAIALTKVGNGAQTLSGTNTYTGGTTLSGGRLNLNSPTAVGAASSRLTIAEISSIDNTSAGPLVLTNNNPQTWNADFTFIGKQDLNLGLGAVTLSGNRQVTVDDKQLTIGGGIAGGFSLTKAGPGTLALSGANTYTGTTTVSSGTLLFKKTAALYNNSPASWTPAKIVVNSGGTLAFSVGGVGEFTAANLVTLLDNSHLGASTAAAGLRPGSNIGLDTTNAPSGTFTYDGPFGNTNGGANAVGLTKLGTGELILSGPNTYSGNTLVAGGTLTTNLLTNGAATTVADNARLKVMGDSIVQSTLEIKGSIGNDTAKVSVTAGPLVPPSSNSRASRIDTLSISANSPNLLLAGPDGPSHRTYFGTFDLANHDLVVITPSPTALDEVSEMIRSGREENWNGKGLTSSFAADTVNNPYAGQMGLGAIRNVADPSLPHSESNSALYTSFSGQTGLTGDETLVKFTWNGDFNLDGQVDSYDYALFYAGLSGAAQSNISGGPGWFFGDADYSGVVDATDLALLNDGYAAYMSANFAPLPEPSTLLLGAFGVAALLAHYRRRFDRQ